MLYFRIVVGDFAFRLAQLRDLGRELANAVAWVRSLLAAHRASPPTAAPGTPSAAGPPPDTAPARATNGVP